MQLVAQAVKTGTIKTNLPPTVDYQPGQVLKVEIEIKNISDREVTFAAGIALLDPNTRNLIDDYLWGLRFNGKETLKLKPGESIKATGELNLPITNCLLAFFLVDLDQSAIVDEYVVMLQGPAAPWESLIPLMGLALLGMMIPLFTRWMKS